MKDFFVSYTGNDLHWAMGIGDWLRRAGYEVVMQEFDFAPGANFVIEMDQASMQAKRTIAVLSPDYLRSKFTAPEWAQAFRRDPTGIGRVLIPVRIRECDLDGLLATVVYIDLVGLSLEEAEDCFLKGIKSSLGDEIPIKNQREADPEIFKEKVERPSPSQEINGNGNVQAGRDVFIDTTKVVRNQIVREEGEISDKEAQRIKELVCEVAEFETEAGVKPNYGKWYRKLQNTFGCTSYKKLREKNFEEAISWLKQSKARIRPKLRRSNNQAWRNDLYKGIYARWKELGYEKEEIYAFAQEKLKLKRSFNSLTKLGEQNLYKLHGIVMRIPN